MGFVGLFVYGAVQGDISLLYQTFLEDNFVHIMSLDFLVFVLVASFLCVEDMERTKTTKTYLAWIPLFGPLLWLCIRKRESPHVHSFEHGGLR